MYVFFSIFFFIYLLLSDLLETRIPHETELHSAVSELFVQVSGHAEAVLKLLLHAGVEEDLHDTRTVSAEAPATANNVSGIDEVIEDALVDGSRGAAALDGLEFVDILWALGDLAMSDEHDDAAREALLELTGQSLLDFADEHDEAERIEDEETLLVAGRVLDFLSSVEVEARETFLEGAMSKFELEEFLGDFVLNLARLGALRLSELAEMRCVRLVRHDFCLVFFFFRHDC